MSTPGREPEVSDDEILAVFEDADDPVLSTKEVADAVGLGRRGILDRLNQLAEERSLERKKIENSRVVWWSPSALESRYDR